MDCCFGTLIPDTSLQLFLFFNSLPLFLFHLLLSHCVHLSLTFYFSLTCVYFPSLLILSCTCFFLPPPLPLSFAFASICVHLSHSLTSFFLSLALVSFCLSVPLSCICLFFLLSLSLSFTSLSPSLAFVCFSLCLLFFIIFFQYLPAVSDDLPSQLERSV